MATMAGLSGFILILIIIAVILLVLLPFFVLRIRNELISMNQKVSSLVELLGGITSSPTRKPGGKPGEEG